MLFFVVLVCLGYQGFRFLSVLSRYSGVSEKNFLNSLDFTMLSFILIVCLACRVYFRIKTVQKVFKGCRSGILLIRVIVQCTREALFGN